MSADQMPPALTERIRTLHPKLTAIRRDIHAHPELGFQERRTAALVAKHLREWNIEVSEGLGGTGVIGTLRGRRAGSNTIGIRADMDALPILEQTGLPYASTNIGTMHACGHDGHTAILLGAARCLAEDPDFAGTVHFIFQPAEEGLGGATAMLEDKLFERFPCDAVYALHNHPGLDVGKLGTRTGPLAAAVGKFDVTFRGPGGHGGLAPHKTVDLSIVLAHYLLALQTIVPRNISASDMAVISAGHIQSNGNHISFSVMPSEIRVSGTMRCFTADIQAIIERRVSELATAIAQMHGAAADIEVSWPFPPLVNTKDQVDAAIEAAGRALGPENVITDMTPIMAGEDFAFMLQRRPGAMLCLGSGPDANKRNMLHSPFYDFNDAIIPYGVALWVNLTRAGTRL